MIPCYECGENCERKAKVMHEGHRFCDTTCCGIFRDKELAKEAAKLVPLLPGFDAKQPPEDLVLVGEVAL